MESANVFGPAMVGGRSRCCCPDEISAQLICNFNIKINVKISTPNHDTVRESQNSSVAYKTNYLNMF